MDKKPFAGLPEHLQPTGGRFEGADFGKEDSYSVVQFNPCKHVLRSIDDCPYCRIAELEDKLDRTECVWRLAEDEPKRAEAKLEKVRGLVPEGQFSHEAAQAFWDTWKANGETGKHGFYESTWLSLWAALKAQAGET